MLIPDITQPDGSIASTSREKATAFMDISFPGEWQILEEAPMSEEESDDQEQEGEAVKWIEDSPQAIERAIRAQKSQKAPGVDRMGAPVLRLMWSWASERIHRLFTECIRRGVHCKIWRRARGVMIPKPGREDMGDCKSYRCISLLNCMVKVLEKVVGTLLEDQLRGTGLIDPGQYGSLRGRSAVDTVATLISIVEEAWQSKRIAGAICMDVRAAFPSVNADCLTRRLEEGGVEPFIVRWVRDFMSERSIALGTNGEDHTIENVRTGLPQGSPVSPLLFAVYMGGIHGQVCMRVQGVRGLSFVDDVMWLATGTSVREVSGALERAASEVVRWGEQNAVAFESRKTEAILFSRS